MDRELVWHPSRVTRSDRERRNGHRGLILWFTGLSGAGKSTLASRVEEVLFQQRCRAYLLDGDNVRHGLCADLGFSAEHRRENIRRIGETARLFMDAGIIVLTAFISPFRADRELVRSLVPSGDFVEVYCNTPLHICECRDPKGLYRKARRGEIPEFTGVSSPYEAPCKPEIEVFTGRESLETCVAEVVDRLGMWRTTAGRGCFTGVEARKRVIVE
ncbi:MAG: adenylyl-sulfate kinase [Methylococcales bacterium]